MLLDTLQNDMKTAMKAGDKARLSTLRLVISAIKYAQVDNPTLDDGGMTSVLQKEAKKRREAIEAYKAAGRDDSAASEQSELEIIESYLPKMLTEEEVRKEVEGVLATGSFPNFGAAMGAAMGKMKGRADGGVVSKIVKELYQ